MFWRLFLPKLLGSTESGKRLSTRATMLFAFFLDEYLVRRGPEPILTSYYSLCLESGKVSFGVVEVIPQIPCSFFSITMCFQIWVEL